MNRRGLLGVILAAAAAPAIVRATSLMPVAVAVKRITIDNVTYDVIVDMNDFGLIARALWTFEDPKSPGRVTAICASAMVSHAMLDPVDNGFAGIPMRVRDEMHRLMRYHYRSKFA